MIYYNKRSGKIQMSCQVTERYEEMLNAQIDVIIQLLKSIESEDPEGCSLELEICSKTYILS